MKKHLKDLIWMIAHYMYPLVLDGYIDTIRDLESLRILKLKGSTD